MPALQVRDLPQDIYEQLVESAHREHRSIAAQTTHILEQHFKVVNGGMNAPAANRASAAAGQVAQPEGASAPVPSAPAPTPAADSAPRPVVRGTTLYDPAAPYPTPVGGYAAHLMPPGYETPEERAARRRKILEEAWALPKLVPAADMTPIEEVIREMRREREEQILEAIGFYKDNPREDSEDWED